MINESLLQKRMDKITVAVFEYSLVVSKTEIDKKRKYKLENIPI